MKKRKWNAVETVKTVKSSVVIIVDPSIDSVSLANQFGRALAEVSHSALIEGDVCVDSRTGNLELHLYLRVKKFAEAAGATSEIFGLLTRLIPELQQDDLSTGTNLLTPA